MSRIAEIVETAMDDDRLYITQFAASDPGIGTGPDAGVLFDLLEDEAERIERTTGALTTVAKEGQPPMGPRGGFYEIQLFAILPRNMDMELFEQVVETARHRALNEAHQLKERQSE